MVDGTTGCAEHGTVEYFGDGTVVRLEVWGDGLGDDMCREELVYTWVVVFLAVIGVRPLGRAAMEIRNLGDQVLITSGQRGSDLMDI